MYRADWSEYDFQLGPTTSLHSLSLEIAEKHSARMSRRAFKFSDSIHRETLIRIYLMENCCNSLILSGKSPSRYLNQRTTSRSKVGES